MLKCNMCQLIPEGQVDPGKKKKEKEMTSHFERYLKIQDSIDISILSNNQG